MSCELINGISGICEYSASGIEKIWLANKADITADTYDAGGILTGVSGSTTYEFIPALDSGTVQDDLVVNGSRRNFLQTINFGLDAMSAEVLLTLETLGLSNMVAFVLDAAGEWRAYGLKGTGLRATVLTEGSGTSTGNDGSIVVTIAGSATGKGSYIDAAVVSQLGLM